MQLSQKKDEITGFRRILASGKTLILDGNSKAGYEVHLLEPRYKEVEHKVSGTIINSLFEAASDQDVPYSVIDELADLLSNKIIFSREIQTGDSFSIKYKKLINQANNAPAGAKLISASIMNRENFYAAVQHRDNKGKVHYFDEEGELLGNYFLRYPLKFSRISSVFSKSRFHPVLNKRRAHNGTDFAAPTGTPIRSVADGIIVKRGYYGGNGNMLKIEHTSRYSTAYLHLSKFAKGIKKNSRVKRGQVIGYVGSTGLATGPHLHFSFYDRGHYVDPLKIKLPQMGTEKASIPKDRLQEALLELRQGHVATRFAQAGMPLNSNS